MERKNSSLAKSFFHAWEGIVQAVKSERNMKIHLFMTAAVAACSIVFSLTAAEKAVVWALCGVVLAAELFNTAIENVVDLCSPEYSPLAKRAKDAAAGAVLVMSIAAAAGGTAVFLPYGIELLAKLQRFI